MNTHQATYETALERMERKMVEREARLERAMSARDKWLYGLLVSLLIGVVLLLARQYFPLA
ncbi:MAG: hypothetical protein F4059_01730 [Gemmatimonadetes bacterium]|nr:hypothetical protein [Gemmatimonadota bacterium]